MRFIPIAVGLILSMSAFADFSEYKGGTYSVEKLAQCEQDFNQVTLRFEKLKGVKVLEGGCLPLNEKLVHMTFSFAHPTLFRLDRLERVVSSKEDCSSLLKSAEASIEKAGFDFIHAYCSSSYNNRLLVDYYDHNHNMIRSADHSFSYQTNELCQGFLKDFSEKIGKLGFSPVLWTCDKSVSYDGKEESYTPNLNISSVYSKKIRFLTGKKMSGTCFPDAATVTKNFEANGNIIAHLFCANKSYGKDLYEIISYVEFQEVPRIKTFKGMVYQTKEVCEEQLLRAQANLNSVGTPALYQFCEAGPSKSFQPVIFYSEKDTL